MKPKDEMRVLDAILPVYIVVALVVAIGLWYWR